MMKALAWILTVAFVRNAHAASQNSHSTISSHGRIVRSEADVKTALVSGGLGGSDQAGSSKVQAASVFVMTTPDEEHVTMLRNMLCSLFSSSSPETARQQEIFVMLHPGQDAVQLGAEELQHSLQSLGYSGLTVLDSQRIFGNHPHWNSLKHGFPSNLRLFGIRHVLAKMAPDSSLLVIDEDVVCSPDRASGVGKGASKEEALYSVPEEVARRAPTGASIVCAHEIPDVVDVFNNGFCLYRASGATDVFLASVEKRMIHLGFTGDQTPFNQVVREAGVGPIEPKLVDSFGPGVVGYLRTWTLDGFPKAGAKELFVVDSTAPETLLQWSPSTPMLPTPASSRSAPLCLHYLPFSPSTHLWSKLDRRC